MSDADCHARRLLNPFLGTKQILCTDQARATSTDGVNWRILIRQDIYKTPWSGLAIPEQHDQYFAYGDWSQQQGLIRLPVHPSLYEEHVDYAVNDLLTRLKSVSQDLPFALKDTLELWLMDIENARPIALLDSLLPGEVVPKRQHARWYPTRNADTIFTSNAFAEKSSSSTNWPTAQEQLIHAIERQCKSPLTAYWIERQPDNSGIILQNHAGKPVSHRATLSASSFPVCLLNTDWTDTQTRQLASDYLQWQSPLLLMLPLPTGHRRTLERLAQQRPLAVHQYHRLYPAVNDPALLRAILVEAVMRAAGADKQGRNNAR